MHPPLLCTEKGAVNQVLDFGSTDEAEARPPPLPRREPKPFHDDDFGNRDAVRCIIPRDAAATAALGIITPLTPFLCVFDRWCGGGAVTSVDQWAWRPWLWLWAWLWAVLTCIAAVRYLLVTFVSLVLTNRRGQQIHRR